MGTKGIVLAVVAGTYCQTAFYLWHSAGVLQIPVMRLFPLQKLAVKFLVILALYAILYFIISGIGIDLKIIIATLFTAIIIFAGILKYIKYFFNKHYVQNS
jgi:hypothetical protein